MKKIISIVIMVCMILCMTAGCAKKVEGTIVSEDVIAEESSDETTSGVPVKMGLVALHDENSTYDKNFINAFKAACEVKGIEYEIKTGIPETNECYEACADLVDRGCNLVFADSFGHESFVIQAAQEFPDVQFAHATGTMAHTENLPNFHNAFASIYEGRYLAGVAGGLKLKEMMEEDPTIIPKVGYVGAFTYAEVISGYTAWFLGVRSIVPEAIMEVQFTGSWYDEALEKEAANTLINNGCVLISQHADSMGAPTACEEAGVPDVTYNGSLADVCPNTSIISSRINWQPYFEYLIDCVTNDEEIAVDWVGTLEDGSVEVSEVNEKAAAKGTTEELTKVKEKLLNKEITVFDCSTFTVGGQTLEGYMADVDTDADYTFDTEVISQGVFLESTFRSAPYFDLEVDGITKLNAAF